MKIPTREAAELAEVTRFNNQVTEFLEICCSGISNHYNKASGVCIVFNEYHMATRYSPLPPPGGRRYSLEVVREVAKQLQASGWKTEISTNTLYIK